MKILPWPLSQLLELSRHEADEILDTFDYEDMHYLLKSILHLDDFLSKQTPGAAVCTIFKKDFVVWIYRSPKTGFEAYVTSLDFLIDYKRVTTP